MWLEFSIQKEFQIKVFSLFCILNYMCAFIVFVASQEKKSEKDAYLKKVQAFCEEKVLRYLLGVFLVCCIQKSMLAS